MKRYYAGIDIGTNTLLLLILSKDHSGVIQVEQDIHRIARLGEGVHEHGIISRNAIERAVSILREYHAILSQYDAIEVKAVATSAMRDANNRFEVLNELESILQYPIECISGTDEALFTFLGSKEQYSSPVILDIGGGSTECIIGNGDDCIAQSIDIGAVRLHDMFMNSLPILPDKIDLAKKYIHEHISALQITNQNPIIATAGTPTTLAAMDLVISDLSNPVIHGHILTIETIQRLTELIIQSTLEDILNIPGVHPQRADILPAGALILQEILQYVNAKECIVSKKGLRYGIAYSLMQ